METRTLPSFNVIGKKVSCSWEQLSINMPKAWQEVINRKEEVTQKCSSNILDICIQLKDGIFTQLVGFEVKDLHEIPIGFEGVHIPNQQYIYTKHTGSEMEIANTFGNMIKWAQENQHTLDPGDFKIQYTPKDISEGYDLYLKII